MIDEPPGSKNGMDSGARLFPPLSFVAGRIQRIRKLWSGDWDIPVARSSIHGRCLTVLTNLQKD